MDVAADTAAVLAAIGADRCLIAGAGISVTERDWWHWARRTRSALWTRRTDRYSELRARQTSRKKVPRKVEMSRIGG